MKALVVKPYKGPQTITMGADLASAQAIVEGYIEILPMEGNVILVCNEEGKILELPPNRVVLDPSSGKVVDIICGTFFLCSVDDDGDFISLTEDQIEYYKERFAF